MHIDHQKLVELVAETSGLDKPEVEEQLEKLVSEIKQAIAEGDAYEIEGFGVFSGIGDNIIFLPNESMETEINYKYVGMEPIEMDSPAQPEDSDSEGEEAPFAGLLDELEDDLIEEDPDHPEEEKEEPHHIFEFDKDVAEEAEESAADEGAGEKDNGDSEDAKKSWGIDAYTDDEDRENNRRLFSGLLDDEDEIDEESAAKSTHGDKEKETEPEQDDEFEAVFGQSTDDTDEMDEFVEEMSSQLAPEEEHVDDGPKQDVPDEPEEVLMEEAEEEDDPFEELAKSGAEEAEKETELVSPADRPDTSKAEDQNKEEKEESHKQETTTPEEEVVPVIKNLASESAKKARKQKAEKKKTSPKKEPSITASREQDQAPVWLWMVLIVLIAGGSVAGLGYAGWIHIPGITPQTSSPQNQQATVQQPAEPVNENGNENEQVPQVGEENQGTGENTGQASPAVEEQPEETPVPEEEAEASVPASQPEYGLMGQANPAANDGYTLVVYSLSNEANARQRQNELSDAGYRVLLAEIPSTQYGTLWRVSLGQFETMRDAAIAAEELSEPLSDNYFITQIQ